MIRMRRSGADTRKTQQQQTQSPSSSLLQRELWDSKENEQLKCPRLRSALLHPPHWERESVSRSVVSDSLQPRMDCSPPGSSVHGIFQTRILECVAISFSRESSWPRDQTQVSCIAGRFFTIWATRETPRRGVPSLTAAMVWNDSWASSIDPGSQERHRCPGTGEGGGWGCHTPEASGSIPAGSLRPQGRFWVAFIKLNKTSMFS